MSSQRLPGKMLVNLNGQSLLRRVVDRVGKSKKVSNLIVATSDQECDQAIEEFCFREGVRHYRGSLDDVADRFRKIIQEERVRSFVRICGDSPLLDPALVDQAIDYFDYDNLDLVSNILLRTYPKGQSVEVIRSDAFCKAYKMLKSNDQREHVTKVFYENPHVFRILSFTSGMDLGRINLCIDTYEDVVRIEKVLDRVDNLPGNWRELAEVYQSI